MWDGERWTWLRFKSRVCPLCTGFARSIEPRQKGSVGSRVARPWPTTTMTRPATWPPTFSSLSSPSFSYRSLSRLSPAYPHASPCPPHTRFDADPLHRTPRGADPRVSMQTLSRPQKAGPCRKQTVRIQPQAHQEVRVSLDESLRFLSDPSSTRTVILLLGWSSFVFLVNRVRNAENDNKVYDPYEILGISAVRTYGPSRARPTALIWSPRAPRRRK